MLLTDMDNTETLETTSTTACCDDSCCGGETVAAATVGTTTVGTTAEAIKETVREKYGEIARSADASCCGDTCGCGDVASLVGDAYSDKAGYVADADLGLGCGLPVDLAGLQPGHTVLDLGSGAGIDVFVARQEVGEEGRVIGVDMTPEMVTKAKENTEKLGFENVEFHLGEIEDLPIENDHVDVVVSNCVLNLVPDKATAFAEMYRVLKPGGHFCVSDIVTQEELPAAIRQSAEFLVGCVAGAQQIDEYLEGLRSAGFEDVEVLKESGINLTPEALNKTLARFGAGSWELPIPNILSITVTGKKPVA